MEEGLSTKPRLVSSVIAKPTVSSTPAGVGVGEEL